MKPVFYASEVASLLGKNRFKPKEESLYRVLSTIPRFKPAFECAKDALTERDILEQISPVMKESVAAAVASSIASTCQTEIKQTIATFQKKATAMLLNEALSGNAMSAEFQDASLRIASKQSSIETEMKRLETTPVVATLTSQIQKQRGTQMESKAEDEHASRTGKEVTQRNTPVRYESQTYILVGYIDGTHDQKVIETKNRKHVWGSPPEYDLIQLKCYMKMKGNVDGVLLERFPNGKSRETNLVWDDAIWEEIHEGLSDVSTQIQTMSLSDVNTLVKNILIKTDRKKR